MITTYDIELVHRALETALKNGAASCRVTLDKSTENLVSTLDGETDRITRCQDCSLTFALFADGRYGSFSTNKTDCESLDEFLRKAVEKVKMLAVDEHRRLPAPDRCCHNATSGLECGIYDKSYDSVTADKRISLALEASLYKEGRPPEKPGYRVISEEGEYSDSVIDSITVDSNGTECRHSETSFDYGVEVTVESDKGDKYCSYRWIQSPFLKNFDTAGCGIVAMENAAGQIGAKSIRSGKYNLVVDSEAAAKFVSPLLNALSGYSIQQHNSFLEGSAGRKIFSEGLTMLDMPHIEGESGSRLYDSECVATKDTAIIEHGIVRQYFINTYMSGKLGMPGTAEEACRPYIKGWPEEGLDRQAIMEMCSDGILVTEFNGGNCNSATGDFSYGIEGYLFRNGRIVHPVSGMLVTGNFLSLWNSLAACGSDARRCRTKLIPTLAFKNIDFNGLL